ncbi:hypothetical protein [Flavobacterium sp.]|uniref:hypothetical protein n=1 Tax=Flavobacterium sp. TaxID=239 RepID=UPI00286D8908|nr:hypothetical protein [Flavobacterium sp.]
MEIKLNKIIYFVILLIISCQGNTQKKSPSTTSSIESELVQEPINFFDKKYFSGYELTIDESNMSDHPFFSYLDCKNEGYFSVHFIPKNEIDKKLWKEEYHKNTDFNTYDFATDNKRIKDIITKKLNNYNIFSYLIEKKYLNTKNGCTNESVFLNKNNVSEIYFYNQLIKKWELVKTEKSDILPPYAANDFFTSHFPELFLGNTKEKEIINKDIAQFFDYDLDRDGVNDKIILYTNDQESGEFENKHFGLPMEIKKGLSNNTYQTWYRNNLIIPKNNFNCATEGFSTIVFKDNYFTIENQICSDYIEISSYITFKVIGGNILLHKYGETYFDKADHEKQLPPKTWSSKDFGNVNFENVTEDFIIKLSQTNPKK